MMCISRKKRRLLGEGRLLDWVSMGGVEGAKRYTGQIPSAFCDFLL